MSDLYGDLKVGLSNSTVGDRHVTVTYLTRLAKSDQVTEKLELGIIQTELNVEPPRMQFVFDPSGEFKLHGVRPSQPPVVAVKLGDVRIELPAKFQLHEIWDGKHVSLDANLTMEIFQRFVDTSQTFPPQLSQLSKFLEKAQSCTPYVKNPDWITFEIEVLHPDGSSIKDILDAPSETAARSKIKEMGYTLTEIIALKNTD